MTALVAVLNSVGGAVLGAFGYRLYLRRNVRRAVNMALNELERAVNKRNENK